MSNHIPKNHPDKQEKKQENELLNFVDKRDEKTESSTHSSESHKRGQHPNSLANLQPFPKGVSGNPGGRNTKYEKMAKALKKIGNKTPAPWIEHPTYKAEVLHKIWQESAGGSIQHIVILAELGCLDDK